MLRWFRLSCTTQEARIRPSEGAYVSAILESDNKLRLQVNLKKNTETQKGHANF